jgi:hypothetical protein
MIIYIIIIITFFLSWLSFRSTKNKNDSFNSSKNSQTKTNLSNLPDETLDDYFSRISNISSLDYSNIWDRVSIQFFEESKKAAKDGNNKLALINIDRAIDYKVLSKNIPNPYYYCFRAIVRANTDYLGAIHDCDKAISLTPKNSFFMVKGLIHYNHGYKSDAKVDLEKAASLGSQNAKEYLIKYFKNDNIVSTFKINQAVVSNASDIKFQPSSEYSFCISNLNNDYHWFAIYNYYPKSRFSQSELTSIDIQVRQHVYDFKDGKNPELYANMFASALINKFGKSFFFKKYILIVPASNKVKTQVRFQFFCKLVSEYLGAINGFNILNNNNKEKSSSHKGGKRDEDLSQYLTINNIIKYKEVIVIDDVRTSGASSNQIFKILNNLSVTKIIFVYLAKTVSLNSAPNNFNNTFEIDDLPF